MSWPVKIIRLSFHLIVFLVPLIFLPNTSELFEFNKMIVTYILTAVIAAAWVIEMILEKRFIFRRTMLDWPIIIFIGIQFLSLLASINPRTSWLGYYSRFNGGLVSLICYSALYWAFVTFMDFKSTLKIITTALFTAALISFYGVLEHFGIDASLWVQDVQNRVFSTLGQPNWLAAYLIILLPLAISRSLSAKKLPQKITSACLSLLILVTILYTKSQSGIGVTLVVLFVYLLLVLIRNRSWKILLTGSGIFLVLVILNLKIITISLESLSYIFTAGDITSVAREKSLTTIAGSSSTLIRRIVWQGAFNIWRSSSKTFWLGTGPETFAMSYYQYRPVAHNYTSEWELLYNKAHNEFVNYLATTGVLGLGSYLLLLFLSVLQLLKNTFPKPPSVPEKDRKKVQVKSYLLPGLEGNMLQIALLAGWLSVSVTNFWGFSVVMVQILMFLLPAMAITLNITVTPPASAASKNYSFPQIIGFLSCLFILGFTLIAIGKYWLADVRYATGQHDLKAFTMTDEISYILSSYNNYSEAFSLNSSDPAITSDLAVVTSYISVLSSQSDATTSSSMAENALVLSQKAVSDNPAHPNYYKSRARTAIILSSIDPKYLDVAVQTLQKAEVISPTDPRIPYNLGVVSRYQGNIDQAIRYFEKALRLKPNFGDAAVQITEITSSPTKTTQ